MIRREASADGKIPLSFMPTFRNLHEGNRGILTFAKVTFDSDKFTFPARFIQNKVRLNVCIF